MSEVLKQMVQITVVRGSQVILQAVTSDNPEFRYVIGEDSFMIIY
jgi:hypothetical protein